jgi:hypothetical protein
MRVTLLDGKIGVIGKISSGFDGVEDFFEGFIFGGEEEDVFVGQLFEDVVDRLFEGEHVGDVL